MLQPALLCLDASTCLATAMLHTQDAIDSVSAYTPLPARSLVYAHTRYYRSYYHTSSAFFFLCTREAAERQVVAYGLQFLPTLPRSGA